MRSDLMGQPDFIDRDCGGRGGGARGLGGAGRRLEGRVEGTETESSMIYMINMKIKGLEVKCKY